ncbi:MAG: site-specific integrase [Opitutus sp.]|nr:site-specific integrase [Opitutus sp.]MCS6278130.1 site-specific integrase [Opitutus sp.]MCS6299240.1 site-specific integrase [Opitutus sp.]
MSPSAFIVSRFVNRNGITSWRVDGRLHGLRIRKNFKTRVEAGAEKDALDIKAAQSDTGIRSTATRLTDEQLHEAEAAFRRLADAPKSLEFYLEYALANYRAPEREITVDDAVAVYLATKKKEHANGMLSECQLKDIRVRLEDLIKWFRGKSLAVLSRETLAAHCQRGTPKPKTFNNRRGILFTFFKFAFCQDWVAANPLEKVPHLRIAHRRGSAKTLNAEQSAALMRHVEQIDGGALVPFFALALFAGIRPCVRTGEIFKLKPEHVRLDTGVILIEPEVSKVRMKRNVTISPNLAAWLTAYPISRFPIIPKNLQHQRARIAEKFGLSHDIMRHTFISMHVAKYRSMGEAALQAGNSESIIRKHYLDLKTPAEAEQFFAILPTPVVAAYVVHIAPTASTNLAADPMQPCIDLPIAA